jgi:hypothetical protein
MRACRDRRVARCIRACISMSAPASEPGSAAAAINTAPPTNAVQEGSQTERDIARGIRGMWSPHSVAPIRANVATTDQKVHIHCGIGVSLRSAPRTCGKTGPLFFGSGR